MKVKPPLSLVRSLLEVRPHSEPPVRILRAKTGRVNLSGTLARMAKGQTIQIHFVSRPDPTRVKISAVNAKVRIRIGQHPALNTILVTSLGPHRKKVASRCASVVKARHFQSWRLNADLRPTAMPQPHIDIFS